MGYLAPPPPDPLAAAAAAAGRPLMPKPAGCPPGAWYRAVAEVWEECPPPPGLWDGPPFVLLRDVGSREVR